MALSPTAQHPVVVIPRDGQHPYTFVKTAGPAHLSLADRGLTFASNGDRGVCLTMREPIPGIDPLGVLRHPNLTVTVADCDGLMDAVQARSRRGRRRLNPGGDHIAFA